MTGYLLVVAAAAMWGFIGVFFTLLHDRYGLSAISIAFLRAGLPAFMLLITLGALRPSLLRVSRRSLALYAGFGLFGIALFYIFNTQAVFLTGVATASVLLYTAPAFVTLFARWQWREPITGRKLIALLLAFVGCALVAQAYAPGRMEVNLLGIILGAAAGLAYACFTVFAKYSSAHSPWTTVTYSLLFGTLFLLPFQFLNATGGTGTGLTTALGSLGAWALIMGLALGPTFGSYALYTAAVRHIPASNASLVATIEPVVATIAGYVFFGQVLELAQLLGAAMIVGGALILSAG